MRKSSLHQKHSDAGEKAISVPSKRRRCFSGFTLLEVMVSMAILATAFAAVLSLHSDSLKLAISSRIQTKASELAQMKMTDIELRGLENVSIMSGEFADYAPDYTWEIRIEPTSYPPWNKVTVIVRNRHFGEKNAYHLTEFLPYGPVKLVPWK
ncbi:MAG: type II secretion system protein [Deltaproteobacteria bacterium]|nr:type II secretion system protein [Deltaproteobacteria bacterium]MBW2304101.1 type II secretion system protein [Deltaproteobacteria bacterium]